MLKAGSVGFGSIGKVSDEITGKFDIKQPVYLAELAVSDLIRISGSRVEFTPLPIYPAAPRDLAIVVRSDIKVGEILDSLTTAAGDLAETIELFDLYIGKQIEKGKKSVGVAITYRSRERSLSSEEVDSLQKKIIAVLKQKFDAEIREKH
jgi:phenylalanyl-tRNA synthetase beta chain